MLHEERGEKQVPVAEESLVIVLEQVLQTKNCGILDLLILVSAFCSTENLLSGRVLGVDTSTVRL